MDEEQFQDIVAQLEQDAYAEPWAYRFRVALLAFAIHGYLALMIGIPFAVLVLGALWMFGTRSIALGGTLMLGGALVLGVVARAHHARLAPPSGRAITADDAPELFRLLQKIRREQRAPATDEVLVCDEYRVELVRTPRLGLLGANRTSLVIGLPFMLATTREQFAAVLAHEYTHLTGAYGWFDAWVYRLRGHWRSWLNASAARRGWKQAVKTPLAYLIDYFHAYTFVLARDHEYEADQQSVAVVGAAATAQALVASSMGSRFYHGRFWPSFWARAHNAPEPPELPFSAFRKHMKLLWTDASQLKPDLDAALARRSTLSDTHPSLRERLDAIGQNAVLPTVPRLTAARALLGMTSDKLTREFDAQWHADARDSWAQRYRDVQNDRQTLEHLRLQDTPLSADEMRRLGALEASYGDVERAHQAFRGAIAAEPNHGRARLDYARFLLESGNEAGLDELDRAFEFDNALIHETTRLGWEFCVRRGMTERAERFNDRFDAHFETRKVAA